VAAGRRCDFSRAFQCTEPVTPKLASSRERRLNRPLSESAVRRGGGRAPVQALKCLPTLSLPLRGKQCRDGAQCGVKSIAENESHF
jgi:hypothetical protein